MTGTAFEDGRNRGSCNPLIRKLESTWAFSDEDRAVLRAVCERTRRVPAGEDVIHYGDPPSDVHLVLDGFAYRYKLLPDGGRQIAALLLPGDFCDLHVAILGAMDHSIATLTPCTLVEIAEPVVHDLTRNHPRIARAFWWATLVDEGTMREWITSLGRRDAVQHLAHFLCEMLLRLQIVGMAEATSFALPLRQSDIADILGLTNVHVSRSLQNLREAGLIVLEQRRFTIPNVDRLRALCGYDPAYLHLGDRYGELARLA